MQQVEHGLIDGLAAEGDLLERDARQRVAGRMSACRQNVGVPDAASTPCSSAISAQSSSRSFST